MLKLAQYKPTIFYALKVWMTSVLVAPLIWYYSFGVRDDSLQFIAATFSEYYAIAAMFGILFAIPGFLFFSAGVILIDRRPWRRQVKRFAAAGLASGLSFLVSFFLYGGTHDWSFVVYAASYVVLIAAGVFVYPWPGIGKVERKSDAYE